MKNLIDVLRWWGVKGLLSLPGFGSAAGVLLTLISGLCVFALIWGGDWIELDSVIQFLLRIEALVRCFLI